MTINCKIMRNSLLKGEAGKALYPRVIKNQAMKSGDFVKMVAANRPVSEASVKAVLSAMSEVLATCLANGNTVQVDGLGTFSIAMKGEIKADENGVLQLKNAGISTLNFQPDKDIMASFDDVKFTLKSHDVFEARTISTADAEAIADQIAAEVGQFTREVFAAKAGISYSYAGNVLKALEGEGKITATTFGRTKVYSKA